MKTIDVVSLVALASISVLILCWTGHDSGSAKHSQLESTVEVVSAADVDSTNQSRTGCCTADFTCDAGRLPGKSTTGINRSALSQVCEVTD